MSRMDLCSSDVERVPAVLGADEGDGRSPVCRPVRRVSPSAVKRHAILAAFQKLQERGP